MIDTPIHQIAAMIRSGRIGEWDSAENGRCHRSGVTMLQRKPERPGDSTEIGRCHLVRVAWLDTIPSMVIPLGNVCRKPPFLSMTGGGSGRFEPRGRIDFRVELGRPWQLRR